MAYNLNFRHVVFCETYYLYVRSQMHLECFYLVIFSAVVMLPRQVNIQIIRKLNKCFISLRWDTRVYICSIIILHNVVLLLNTITWNWAKEQKQTTIPICRSTSEGGTLVIIHRFTRAIWDDKKKKNKKTKKGAIKMKKLKNDLTQIGQGPLMSPSPFTFLQMKPVPPQPRVFPTPPGQNRPQDNGQHKKSNR